MGQKDLSKLLFRIQPTLGWDNKTNKFDSIKKRQADVYVFCVHNHVEQKTANPLDLKQWNFYLLSTRILNEKAGNQKSITLSSLLKIGAISCDYVELHEKIIDIVDIK
ncbi:hypothetical protein [Clostridium sp. D33t1_170424_F3]|uniref:hypothetical protein n=1 Tax=Clostridium sp. D33t1_170424_F3 TaxID=2787099 RepID=UPI0018AA3682|nr:hypothetical protein [Clostridium sp. D33t1_170424_F3]